MAMKLLQDNGISVPKYAVASTADQAYNIAKELGEDIPAPRDSSNQTTVLTSTCIVIYITIQIMNGYECNGTDILKDEKFYSSQVGKKTFHLSQYENICISAQMKNIVCFI